ncbi:argonaute 5 [Stylosanthes scabra]|uniref:Argonaute 5 n=1 Tax=Stylosanthes scabra TaxID=79078 RepID=A0ABU6UBW4_9FABA|nr:argonaute 5 [Stylosanthes scabra]
MQYNIPLVSDKPTLILGADVTHPRPRKTRVVGSMDWPFVTQYRAAVSAQRHCEEIIQDLYNTSEHGGMIRLV